MVFFVFFWPFPAARSRVVIRLAENTKAKPNANTRTLRPDKCLVVSSLSPGLRPFCPRNTGANAATTREGSNTRHRPGGGFWSLEQIVRLID
jgi:hypothetical protein